MKKSIALILAVLMLVPCFVTAASARWGDPEVEYPDGAAPGFVCVKEEYVSHGEIEEEVRITESVYNKNGQPVKTVKVYMGERGFDYGVGLDNVMETVYRTDTTTFAYDGSGNLIEQRKKNEYYDGQTETSVYTYRYNANGDIAKESCKYKRSAGYLTRSVTVYTYNRKDLLVKRSKKTVTERGTTQEVYRCTYNSAGQPTKETTLYKPADGIEEKVTAYAYDKNGRVKKISAVVYYYNRLEKTVTAYSYDKNGNVTKKVIGEYRDKVLQSTTAEAYAYNSKGNLTKTKYVEKTAEGSITQYVRRYTYGTNGKLLKTVDTDPENPNYLRTISYNKAGKVIKDEISDREENQPIFIERFTYDKNGRLTKWVYAYYWDFYYDPVDDYGDYGFSFEYTYDNSGNLLTEKYQSWGEDNSSDYTYTYTYQKIGA